MMVGRLFNAKVRRATLEDVFDVDRKTIRSWGRAIRSRDPELLARVLLGRGVNQKRTPDIDRYVIRRWAQLRAEGCLDFRAALAREVKSIFEVSLNNKTLMDAIKISARNLFYRLFAPFKTAYDNYRYQESRPLLVTR